MSMKKTFFGALPDGKPVDCYTIENQNGMRAEILTYGGTLNKLYVPDQNGVFADVLIGFDTLEGHLNHSDYQGMLVGRYANRIADGAFVLNGEEYHVTKNENQITCLHGGGEFSHAVWDAQPVGEDALRLSYESPEGAQGFPGRVTAHAVYTLTQENVLRIDYYAVSDRDTILNLTNHAYFNLGGYDAGQITGHILRLNAKPIYPTDARNIQPVNCAMWRERRLTSENPKRLGMELIQTMPLSPPARAMIIISASSIGMDRCARRPRCMSRKAGV